MLMTESIISDADADADADAESVVSCAEARRSASNVLMTRPTRRKRSDN
jgi:hypothetical protein